MLVDTVFTFESCCQNRSNAILGNSCLSLQSLLSFEWIPHQALAHHSNQIGHSKCDWIWTLLQWSFHMSWSARKCCSGVCPHQAPQRQLYQMLRGYFLVYPKIPMCPLAINACSGHWNWVFLVFHVLRIRKLYFPKPDDSDSNLNLGFCVYECMWPVRLYDCFLSFVCMTFIFN